MNFESLANELLLDLFEYLNGTDLFQAFYGLNIRLNNLLRYHFDFRSISKSKFHFICQNYFPLITDQILSLSLSNDDETPNLLELFLSYDFHFNQFHSLQSLSLYSIESIDILINILHQCQTLNYLRQFKISHWNIPFDETKIQTIMNTIWKLSLVSCCFDTCYSGNQCFFQIGTICQTMKCLLIENILCDLNVVYHLYRYTPNLQQLSISSDFLCVDEEIETKSVLPLKSFKLFYEGSIVSLTNLFLHLPNLLFLTIKMLNLCLNGYEWEKILKEYLPNLKSFRLKMIFSCENSTQQDEEIDQLLDTFRTPFWLEERQWFVQCDWNPYDVLSQCILYTLPYDFGDFFYFDTIRSQCTSPNGKKTFSYYRVNILRHSFSDALPIVRNCRELVPKFYNIIDLKINIPFDNHFWSCMPSLNQLKTLEIFIDDETDYSQLELLVKQAPNLYALHLRSTAEFQMEFLHLEKSSLRRLDLMTKFSSRLGYFNDEECLRLAQSKLGQQCEVLLISVENRKIICRLIDLMFNLRSLTFHSKDDRFNPRRYVSTEDELLQWLIECLSSKCSVLRDQYQTSRIHIWIE